MPARERAKYVYGVVRSTADPGELGEGISDAPLGLVAENGLAALVSEVEDAPLEADRDDLLTHARVLENALSQGAVLPMRFGVIMPSDEAIRAELLRAHSAELEAQLDEMEDKVELSLKGLYVEAQVLREVVAENRDIARLRKAVQGKPADAAYYERIRLGELVAEALERKRAGDSERIMERVGRQAIKVAPGELLHERMAVNASFLVARDSTDEFNRALDELAYEERERIRFTCTGPLPPHSFVELSMES